MLAGSEQLLFPLFRVRISEEFLPHLEVRAGFQYELVTFSSPLSFPALYLDARITGNKLDLLLFWLEHLTDLFNNRLGVNTTRVQVNR